MAESGVARDEDRTHQSVTSGPDRRSILLPLSVFSLLGVLTAVLMAQVALNPDLFMNHR